MQPHPDHGEHTYRGQDKLLGKTALITGGDSGIGRAVAIAFAREGADVAISYMDAEEDDATESARWIQEAGRKVLKLPGDVSDGRYCADIVEQTVRDLGRLDVLVNAAAVSHNRQSILEMPFEEWDYTFKVNLYAMFHT